MTPDRWRQIEALYHVARTQPADKRTAFLTEACGTDVDLHAEVERLLKHDADASAFLEAQRPAKTSSTDAWRMLGARLGVYDIVAPIGAGGMGEIYRAHDARLGRDVAIKILPASVADNADRLRRFEREARAAAALNHPNILAVHDVGTDRGVAYLVTELLEGRTLRQELAATGSRRLALDRILAYAVQLAEGLSAAHAKGIVHRDIKPENLFITGDGRVKILDFGLAKVVASGESESGATTGTVSGMILGTVGYMAPEQVRGDSVDTRADVFAFGCVLYEMLSGRRAFSRDTTTETLTAILMREPDWDALPQSVPSTIHRVLQRCLQKEPRDRLHHISDARIELDEAISVTEKGPSKEASREPAARRIGIVTMAAIVSSIVAIGALAAVAVIQWRGTTSPPAATIAGPLTMTALTSTGNAELATLSPDGKFVAYVQTEDGNPSVWLRQLSSGSTVRIVAPASDGPIRGLAIAPDSSFVDFLRSRSAERVQPMDLWRVRFLGGQARKVIEDVASAPGWSADGRQIAYFVTPPNEIRLIVAKADGSEPRAIASRKLPFRYVTVSTISRPDMRPVWFPDGRAIVVVGQDDKRGLGSIQLISVDAATGVETELRSLDSKFALRRAGMVLNREGQSVTINLAESGPTQVVTIGLRNGNVTRLTNDLAMYGGVSAAGDVIVTTRYQTNSDLWVTDAAGHNVRQVGRNVPSAIRGLSWSGSGRLLYDATLADGAGVWGLDVADGTSSFVVPGGAFASASADGRTLVFLKLASGELWRSDADGSHGARIARGFGAQIAPDGSKMFYRSSQSGVQAVWVVDLAGGEPRQFTTGMPVPATSDPEVSPDGRRVMFLSGRSAIIMPIEGGEPVLRIPMPSTRLRWTPDGRGLTYAEATGANLWVQPIDGGQARQLTTFADNKMIANFAWSPDGKQLAIVREVTTSDVVLLSGGQVAK